METSEPVRYKAISTTDDNLQDTETELATDKCSVDMKSIDKQPVEELQEGVAEESIPEAPVDMKGGISNLRVTTYKTCNICKITSDSCDCQQTAVVTNLPKVEQSLSVEPSENSSPAPGGMPTSPATPEDASLSDDSVYDDYYFTFSEHESEDSGDEWTPDADERMSLNSENLPKIKNQTPRRNKRRQHREGSGDESTTHGNKRSHDSINLPPSQDPTPQGNTPRQETEAATKQMEALTDLNDLPQTPTAAPIIIAPPLLINNTSNTDATPNSTMDNVPSAMLGHNDIPSMESLPNAAIPVNNASSGSARPDISTDGLQPVNDISENAPSVMQDSPAREPISLTGVAYIRDINANEVPVASDLPVALTPGHVETQVEGYPSVNPPDEPTNVVAAAPTQAMVPTPSTQGNIKDNLHCCFLCKIYFEHKVMYTIHMAQHGANVGTCSSCSRRFPSPLSFYQHFFCGNGRKENHNSYIRASGGRGRGRGGAQAYPPSHSQGRPTTQMSPPAPSARKGSSPHVRPQPSPTKPRSNGPQSPNQAPMRRKGQPLLSSNVNNPQRR